MTSHNENLTHKRKLQQLLAYVLQMLITAANKQCD